MYFQYKGVAYPARCLALGLLSFNNLSWRVFNYIQRASSVFFIDVYYFILFFKWEGICISIFFSMYLFSFIVSELQTCWSGKSICYAVLTTSVATICHPEHYYNTTDYIPYVMPFIPVTYSFHDWKPVSPSLLHPLCPSLLSRLATTSWFSVFMGLFPLCLFGFFRLPIQMKSDGIFLYNTLWINIP